MSNNPKEIKFALEFPQGHILFMKNDDQFSRSDIGAVYFLPNDERRCTLDAFLVYGERKELFGKHAINITADKALDLEAYSIVYEFSDAGALTDARLINGAQTVRGKLADEQFVQVMNATIALKGITFYDHRQTRPDTIFNVAKFDDGRLLVQLFNKNELYIGTPGNFEKVDAHLHVQGGNSMYYRLASGGTVELPWSIGGPRAGEAPTFDGEELTYVTRIQTGADPATLGLNLARGVRHLAPFSAELSGGKQGNAPKPPGLS